MEMFTHARVAKDRKALEEASQTPKKPTTPDGPSRPIGERAIHRCNPEHPCRICGRAEVAPPPLNLTDDSIFSPAPVTHRYGRLKEVLARAFNQAATGKGAARHGQDLPFEQQPMQTLSRSLGSNVGLLYQAAKKAQESLRLDREHAVFELLGAINYLAGAVIFLEDRDGDGE